MGLKSIDYQMRSFTTELSCQYMPGLTLIYGCQINALINMLRNRLVHPVLHSSPF